MALFLSPGVAVAQCPPIPDAEYAIEAASTAFVGRVMSTKDLGLVAEVQVLSVWKGRDLPQVVEVRGATDSTPSSDSRRLDAGQTYLVIPENSRAPFLATACSATQGYAGPPNVIPTSYQDGAGAAAGRPPIGSEPADDTEAELTTSILPLLGLIGLIAAAWLIISRLRSLEPERMASVASETAPPSPQQPEKRHFKRRSLRRDAFRTKRAARRTVRRHKRGLKGYRRRQDRQVAYTRRSKPRD